MVPHLKKEKKFCLQSNADLIFFAWKSRAKAFNFGHDQIFLLTLD